MQSGGGTMRSQRRPLSPAQPGRASAEQPHRPSALAEVPALALKLRIVPSVCIGIESGSEQCSCVVNCRCSSS